MRKIVVHVAHHESRAAIIEDERLVEFYVEKNTEDLVGNIYIGKVVNVLPGMQAAFIDIGYDKNAFLYVDDAIPPENGEDARNKPKPSIKEILHEGKQIIVQVKKEAFGSKGPRVTTHVSLPGRYLVYVPTGDYVGVSRRINDEDERNRLKTLGETLKTEEEAVIIRTVAEGISEKLIKRDLQFLRALWNRTMEQTKNAKIPALLYKDLGLVPRLVRDLLSDDVKQFAIDDAYEYRRIREIIQFSAPELVERLHLYSGKEHIFEAFHIQAEIDKATKRKVWLKSGGYIILDKTEALTSIDVNTGKFIGHSHLEDTVLKTNTEAAIEIARQLRLRDIGGIIIIDFIDMEQDKHKEKILKVLQDEMRKDRTKSNILGLTQLGLVEMTRKKVRQNLESVILRPCPMCDGVGRVISEEEMSYKIEREIMGYEDHTTIKGLTIEVNPHVASQLIGTNGDNLHRIEKQLGKKIHIKGNPTFHFHHYELQYILD